MVLFHFLFNILYHDSYHPYDGNDKGSESKCSKMVTYNSEIQLLKLVMSNIETIEAGYYSWQKLITNCINYLPKLDMRGRVGTSFLSNVQYQEAKAPANTISPIAEKKNSIHNNPKKL